MSVTTIKVSTKLRDRINRDAQEHGLTAARFIENLLDAYDRQRRIQSFGKAFRDADKEYWDEFKSWDLALGGALNAD